MEKCNKYLLKNYKLLFVLSTIISTCFIFFAGKFSNSALKEETSFYAANVVKNETNSGKTLGISIKKGDSKNNLPECFGEFHNMYGVFKEQTITFAPLMNSDKKIDIKLVENETNITNTLSFLYYGPVGSEKYNDFYKHYVLPIQLMFEDNKIGYDKNRYIINISETQADKLLRQRGLSTNQDGKYSIEQYKTLLYTECTLSNNGDFENFCINNIYLERNYYYEGLKETLGDFVMASYYLPWDLRSQQENCYFINDDSFQNKYIFNYIENVYGKKDYNINIIKNNLKNDVDENKLLLFMKKNETKESAFSSIFLILGIIFSIFGILILFLNPKKNIIVNTLLNLSYLLGYSIFFILFKVTGNLFLFSSFSCNWFLIVSITSLLITFILCFISKICALKKEIFDYEEISI